MTWGWVVVAGLLQWFGRFFNSFEIGAIVGDRHVPAEEQAYMLVEDVQSCVSDLAGQLIVMTETLDVLQSRLSGAVRDLSVTRLLLGLGASDE